ncbi:MAG: zinc ribbon domain-containing protein, partial [Puniceicoccaceae bacterium]
EKISPGGHSGLAEPGFVGEHPKAMPSNQMIPLLALQARDLDLRKALLSLQAFPEERAQVREEIARAEAALGEKRAAVKASEVLREQMDADAESAREKIRRLRNQQLEVRKNEEYEALTHEIASLEKLIDGIEEKEIVLLDEIEVARSALRETEAATKARVDKLSKTLAKIDADEKSARDRLDGMKEDVGRMRPAVDPALLVVYDGLWKQIKRPPVVVPLEDQKCGGCHLRVSNEVAAGAREFRVVTCDQCGRLLFVE